MNYIDTSDRLYAVRRPFTAFTAGASVALLAGLIGLGGAEFRLPLLILVFALYPHRAIRINLLISLVTLAVAAGIRLQVIQHAAVYSHLPEIIAMSVGGIAAAWIGAGVLVKIPKSRVMLIVAVLLGSISILLVVETVFAGSTGIAISPNPFLHVAVGFVAGIAVGAVSSMLGVAGGEFIIPILMFVFGADIKTAGTASVLISTPIVLTGVARHILEGRFRSTSMLVYLVLPMSLGSIVGAMAGGYLANSVPIDILRFTLAAILLASAIKLWRKPESTTPNIRG